MLVLLIRSKSTKVARNPKKHSVKVREDKPDDFLINCLESPVHDIIKVNKQNKRKIYKINYTKQNNL